MNFFVLCSYCDSKLDFIVGEYLASEGDNFDLLLKVCPCPDCAKELYLSEKNK